MAYNCPDCGKDITPFVLHWWDEHLSADEKKKAREGRKKPLIEL